MRYVAWSVLMLLALTPASEDARAEEDEIASEEVKVGKDDHKRYFRMGPKKGKYAKKAPKNGYGLLIIMPGGNGGAGFHGFCKNIYRHGTGKDFIAVQPIAPMWMENQPIIWPTKKNKIKKMKFSTETFIDDVIKDVGKWKKVDPKRIHVFAWSSSGPAAYAISLDKKAAPRGYFVAMSVFKPNELPKLSNAKGRAYFIYHSEKDARCPYRMAKDAEKQLTKKGAKVLFHDYGAGHSWMHPKIWPDVKKGMAFLEKSVK